MERLGELADSELGFILEKISRQTDRKSCSEVCKQWYSVEALTRSHLCIKYTDHLPTILPRFPNIISLRVPGKFSDSHLSLLSKTCPKIQCIWLRYEDLSFEARETDELDSDDLGDSGLYAIATACSDLTYIALCFRKRVTDSGVSHLIQFSCNLVNLDLEGCINITDQSLEAIAKSSNLKYLNLKSCRRITNLGMNYLANGSVAGTLVGLMVARCDKITDGGLLNFRKMRCLEDLSLAHCGLGITDKGGVMVSEIPTLKRLSLSYLKSLTDASLYAVCEKCPDLIDVKVANCEFTKPCVFACYKIWRTNAKKAEAGGSA